MRQGYGSGVAKPNAVGYAHQALGKMDGDEEKAVNLLVQWVQRDSAVRLALFPEDSVRRRAREVVRKAIKERLERGQG